MTQTSSVFDQRLDFDPAGDFEACLKRAPAKWVVYLLADERDQPIQLLCVKNLRYSLKRRLGGNETIGLSKRVDYREIVRRIYWRRVDSTFEADWLYYEAARVLFPQTYQGMVGFRPAWFVHVDADVACPRYSKTTELAARTGNLFGPVEDKHAAGKLVELIEDAFDLCRYHHIPGRRAGGQGVRVQGDGQVPGARATGRSRWTQYRQLVQWSVRTLEEPAEFLREQERRCRPPPPSCGSRRRGRSSSSSPSSSSSARARSGTSGRWRSSRSYPPARPPGRAGEGVPRDAGRDRGDHGLNGRRPSWCRGRCCARRSSGRRSASGSPTRRAPSGSGIAAHHLFSAKGGGAFLRLETVDEKAIAKAVRELQKQPEPAEAEGEGVLKELQSL
jgi:hypothetical protein